MIIESIIGNIHHDSTGEFADRAVDSVTLASTALVNRIQRLTTATGEEFGLRLPAGSPDLADGDVLFADSDRVIVVKVETSDVLVISPRSIYEMGVVAHTLGNRHLQAQFFDSDSDYGAEVMVCQYDHTVEDYLQSVAVPHSREQRLMRVPFRHTEHTH